MKRIFFSFTTAIYLVLGLCISFSSTEAFAKITRVNVQTTIKGSGGSTTCSRYDFNCRVKACVQTQSTSPGCARYTEYYKARNGATKNNPNHKGGIEYLIDHSSKIAIALSGIPKNSPLYEYRNVSFARIKYMRDHGTPHEKRVAALLERLAICTKMPSNSAKFIGGCAFLTAHFSISPSQVVFKD